MVLWKQEVGFVAWPADLARSWFTVGEAAVAVTQLMEPVKVLLIP